MIRSISPRHRSVRLVGIVLAAFLFGGTASAQQASSGTTNGIAAVVNTQVVTKLEIEKIMRSKKEDMTNRSVSEKERIFKQYLINRVIEILELQATRESGVAVSEEDFINERTGRIEALGYESEEDFRRFLDEQGISEKEFNENVRKEQDAKAWLETVGGRTGAKSPTARPRFNVTATAKEMQAFYKKNLKDIYQQQDEIRLSIIQVFFRRDVPQERAKQEQTMRGLVAKLNTKADFAVLAARESKHPSTKDKGGDTGWIKKGSDKITEEIEKLVFADGVKEGDLIGPIEQGNSFWLVRIDGRHLERTVTFEEAQSDIKQRILRIKFGRAIKQILLELTKNSYIYPTNLRREVEDVINQTR